MNSIDVELKRLVKSTEGKIVEKRVCEEIKHLKFCKKQAKKEGWQTLNSIMEGEKPWKIGVTSSRRGFRNIFYPVVYDEKKDLWHGYAKSFVAETSNIHYQFRNGQSFLYTVLDRDGKRLPFRQKVRTQLYAIKCQLGEIQ
jgi:hypothetical protein